MSFINQIPLHVKTLNSKEMSIRSELLNLWAKLEGDEEAQIAESHSCSCEYCPYKDVIYKPLDSVEIADIEKKIAELEPIEQEIKRTIKSLENYAKLWKVEVET